MVKRYRNKCTNKTEKGDTRRFEWETRNTHYTLRLRPCERSKMPVTQRLNIRKKTLKTRCWITHPHFANWFDFRKKKKNTTLTARESKLNFTRFSTRVYGVIKLYYENHNSISAVLLNVGSFTWVRLFFCEPASAGKHFPWWVLWYSFVFANEILK